MGGGGGGGILTGYYGILHIMTSFGIQPPGPSRGPSPLFLHAVLKVAGHAPVSCDFLGSGISGFLWTQGLSPPA